LTKDKDLLTSSIKTLKDEISKLKSTNRDNENHLPELKRKIDQLQTKLNKCNNNEETLRKSLSEKDKQLSKLTKDLIELKETTSKGNKNLLSNEQKLLKEIERLKGVYENIQEKLKRCKELKDKHMEELTLYKKLNDENKNKIGALEKEKKDLNTLITKKIEKLTEQNNKYEKQIKELEVLNKQLDKTNNKLEETNKQLEKTNKHLKVEIKDTNEILINRHHIIRMDLKSFIDDISINMIDIMSTINECMKIDNTINIDYNKLMSNEKYRKYITILQNPNFEVRFKEYVDDEVKTIITKIADIDDNIKDDSSRSTSRKMNIDKIDNYSNELREIYNNITHIYNELNKQIDTIVEEKAEQALQKIEKFNKK
jgi:chromosome segregation ATPase